MLPRSHYQCYQEFLELVSNLRESTELPDPDVVLLEQQFHKIQSFHQDKILALNSQDLDSEILLRWQSLQTENHRSLRLMATTMMFLRTSRSNATTEARLASLREEIQRIIDRCQWLLSNFPLV